MDIKIDNLGEWIGIGNYRFRKDKIQLFYCQKEYSNSKYYVSIKVSYGDSMSNMKTFEINGNGCDEEKANSDLAIFLNQIDSCLFKIEQEEKGPIL